LSPPPFGGGGLGATYGDNLKLIGKHVVDFLLVLIELFPLGVTAEALRANIGSKPAISLQRGPVDPKFPVEGIAPTNHSSYQKIRLNDLSYGIKIWIDHSSILSQITRFSDKQTGWLRSTVGRTPVFGRRTDPVLRSACSRRVTTMWVNRLLQVSQLGQLSLSSFRGR